MPRCTEEEIPPYQSTEAAGALRAYDILRPKVAADHLVTDYTESFMSTHIEINNLVQHFPVEGSDDVVRAVDGVR